MFGYDQHSEVYDFEYSLTAVSWATPSATRKPRIRILVIERHSNGSRHLSLITENTNADQRCSERTPQAEIRAEPFLPGDPGECLPKLHEQKASAQPEF